MTAQVITLNSGVGGSKVLSDSLTTVDAVAAPAGAEAQFAKVGYGAQSDFKSVSDAQPLPVSDGKLPALALTRTVLLSAVLVTGASAAQTDNGRAPTISYSLTGTGALTATVLLQARNVVAGEWATLVTTSMSGTTAVGDFAAGVIGRYMEFRVNLIDRTGTSATFTAAMAR